MRSHLASLVDDFRRHGRDRAVVTYIGVRRHITTYAELAQLTGRFASEYARRELKPGHRIVIWGENSALWIAAFFGCILNGIIAVPLDVNGSADFAARVIGDVSPQLVIADAEQLRLIDPSIAHIDLEQAANILPPEPTFAVNPAVTLETPFQIIFTSGTTSEPKGIVHTHRNVLASLEPIEREMQKYLRYERPFHPVRFLHCLPLSHVFGQFMGLWIPPLLGAEVHFEEHLEPSRMVSRIHRERISFLIAVPRALDLLRGYLLQKFPELTDELQTTSNVPFWKRIFRFRRVHRTFGWKFWVLICGGAALSGELELFWGRMGFALIQGYGMTETAALITLNHPFHIGQGTIGKPLPGREVRLGPEGEVQVRGDMVSTATWRNGRMERREEEWLATGDLATQDETGELRLVGRKGDSIVTAAGLNIFPSDLEAALLAQTAVHAAAVVGCTGRNGPEPVAVLIAGGDDAAVHKAVQAANSTLAEFQRIRRVLRWPEQELPFTSTGKLLRRKIAEWACAQISPTAPAAVDTAAQPPAAPAPARRLEAKRRLEHRYYRWPWWKPVQWLRVAFQELVMRLLVWLLAAPRVRPAKKVRAGPVLLIANHATIYDVLLVLYGLPPTLRRRVAPAMAGELLLDYRRGRGAVTRMLNPLMPLAYWLLTMLFNVFPLPRSAAFRASFAHAGDALDNGYSVLVFPEGHLTTDGKLHAFRHGVGLLAQQAQVAVLPVALAGLGELAMRKSGWFRSGKLEVRVGEAIPYESGRDPETFTQELEAAMRRLLG